MTFEMYDRHDDTVGQETACGPRVQVDSFGNLLLSPPVWAFVRERAAASGPEWTDRPKVALLFDDQTRTAAIRPLSQKEALLLPGGKLWAPMPMRSREWPRQVRARQFCENYRIGADVYPALVVETTPAMATFAVGRPRPLPTSLPGSPRFATGGVIE